MPDPSTYRREMPWAAARSDCLPAELRGRFGVLGLDLLAASYHSWGLTWTEARCFAQALWRAGDYLDHAVSKLGISQDARMNLRNVKRAFKAMVEGGLIEERPAADVTQSPGRKRKGGSPSIGFRFRRWEDMPGAIKRYLASVPRRAQSSQATMRLYRWAGKVAERHKTDDQTGEETGKPRRAGGRIGRPEQGGAYLSEQGGASATQTVITEGTDSDLTLSDLKKKAAKASPCDCDRERVRQILEAQRVSHARAAELAAWPKSTPKLIEQVIGRCHREKPLDLGAYVATAVGKEVEPPEVRAVREAAKGTGAASGAVRDVQVANVRQTQGQAEDLDRKRLDARLAELNSAEPPVQVAGITIGHGAAYAYRVRGFLLIFENAQANNGAALFAFRSGQRDLSQLPGVLRILPQWAFSSLAREATG